MGLILAIGIIAGLILGWGLQKLLGSGRATQAELVCWEAYNVVGSLLIDLNKHDTPEAERILDNLSQARKVHDNVLPWPSYSTHKEPS